MAQIVYSRSSSKFYLSSPVSLSLKMYEKNVFENRRFYPQACLFSSARQPDPVSNEAGNNTSLLTLVMSLGTIIGFIFDTQILFCALNLITKQYLR